VHAAGIGFANVRNAFRQTLRHIPILGGVYAVVASLGLVALIVGVIGIAAVHTTNKQVRELEEVANRAFFAEHANSLIYAVVMDSRGVYMSSEATAKPANCGPFGRCQEISGFARMRGGPGRTRSAPGDRQGVGGASPSR
jgi:hypothetical protein